MSAWRLCGNKGRGSGSTRRRPWSTNPWWARVHRTTASRSRPRRWAAVAERARSSPQAGTRHQRQQTLRTPCPIALSRMLRGPTCLSGFRHGHYLAHARTRIEPTQPHRIRFARPPGVSNQRHSRLVRSWPLSDLTSLRGDVRCSRQRGLDSQASLSWIERMVPYTARQVPHFGWDEEGWIDLKAGANRPCPFVAHRAVPATGRKGRYRRVTRPAAKSGRQPP